jgi:hypothetical protein
MQLVSAYRNGLIVLFSCVAFSCSPGEERSLRIEILPDQEGIITSQIQEAIDSCSNAGGGEVVFKGGKYLTGGLKLRSNVTLHLAEGALLTGSSDFMDYGEGHWTEGLITGDSLTNIGITGKGTIDGVNCKNPNGEEGFRGPHAIRLTNCNNIKIEGITIVNSANWAINCRYWSKVKIRGGHDGLHTRFCSNFEVSDCDFRTGDDCFAGNDNENFTITNCKVNTSCNGFRLGCLNLRVENCQIWGPGEFKHLSQDRNNMLAAFVHFSPKDQDPKKLSGNWHLKDINIEHVDKIYHYHHEKGQWQTGMPVTSVVFDGLKVSDVTKGFTVKGDPERQFNLTIKNAHFSAKNNEKEEYKGFEGVRPGTGAFFNMEQFDKIDFERVTFVTHDQNPVLFVRDGNSFLLQDVKMESPFTGDKLIKANLGHFQQD